uniref:phosphoinositide phospholipase C n=1 Tax=Gallus gallus TaxID=9031 RepID=A0A8V0YM76_CHICK
FLSLQSLFLRTSQAPPSSSPPPPPPPPVNLSMSLTSIPLICILSGENEVILEVSANIELHLAQDWFHGKLGAGHGGRHVAERLLTEYCTKMGAPDGSFLVRESETFVGDYVLSIWCDEKVQHFRIHWRQDTNIHRFFLTDNMVFDSLYDLITHYRETPMRYSGLEMSPLHKFLFCFLASTFCSKVPPSDGGTQISGSRVDQFSKITGLFSQPWVTLSRLTESFSPHIGISYSKANNLRLPLAKSGRKSILQIQKVNSTYSFPNLVNKVHGFTTMECMHSTVLLLAFKSCTKL